MYGTHLFLMCNYFKQYVKEFLSLKDLHVCNLRVYPHRAAAAPLEMLLQRIQWIYTVLNTPSSSGSGFSSGVASGKDPIGPRPIFQAVPLHIVVGFF